MIWRGSRCLLLFLSSLLFPPKPILSLPLPLDSDELKKPSSPEALDTGRF